MAPTEDFSEVHHVTANSLREAQIAKRRLDDVNFYGAALHVVYAPEMETVDETLQKMKERERRYEKGLAKIAREDAEEANRRKMESEEKTEQDVENRGSGTCVSAIGPFQKTSLRSGPPSKRKSTETGKGRIAPSDKAATSNQPLDIDSMPMALHSHEDDRPPSKKFRLDGGNLEGKRNYACASTPKPKIVFTAEKFKPKTK